MIPSFLPFSTALVTPFLEDGTLAEAPVRHLVGQLASEGIPAFLVSGSTGEQHSMTVDERCQLYAWAVAEAGETPVYAGVAAVRTQDAVRLAAGAARAGARGLMLGFPPYLRPSLDDVRAYVHDVCSAVPLPVLIYNNPARTGFDLLPDQLAVLVAENPSIRAVKEAGGLDRAPAHRKTFGPEFGIFAGNDRTAAEAWAAGFDGLTSIAANLWPREMAGVANDLTSGRVDVAGRTLGVWAEALQTVVEAQLPGSLKFALRLAGRPGGWCRQPLGHLGADREQAIRNLVAGGLPPGRGAQGD
jgi:4-hydroxy-tetrahydrodipicolinate synthase